VAEGVDRIEAGRLAGRIEAEEDVVANAKTAGVRAAGRLFEFAMSVDRIVRLARSHRADVIAMGTHGGTGFRRALLGSVAARVIAFAACPVLTVRA
jgi:nucleotide-binding universal stress UspA family protein